MESKDPFVSSPSTLAVCTETPQAYFQHLTGGGHYLLVFILQFIQSYSASHSVLGFSGILTTMVHRWSLTYTPASVYFCIFVMSWDSWRSGWIYTGHIHHCHYRYVPLLITSIYFISRDLGFGHCLRVGCSLAFSEQLYPSFSREAVS